MNSKPLIFDQDHDALVRFLSDLGEPEYRAAQLWEGLYKQYWNSSRQFSNLPNSLRQTLFDAFAFGNLTPGKVVTSSDGQTQKILFHLPDGQSIETVLMRYDRRNTLCISSQAGCAIGCVFCATGQMGLRRNLTSGEIVEQVLYFARQLQSDVEKVTNVVFMGMGEPFHNYDATIEAIDRLNDPTGMNLGSRRFTISTVGLVPQIKRFTAEKSQVNLAISLHAADDELRSSLIPVNKKYPLKDLLQACCDYIDQSRRRITFEWALIQAVNDTPEQAEKLAQLLDGLLCHVNVIPLNPTRGYTGEKSSRDRVHEFKAILDRSGIPCTIRVRRGIDIKAGCGQLASGN